MLPAHWEGGASATLTNPLRGRKDWTPARARRKGGMGEFRRARAFRQSEAGRSILLKEISRKV